MLTWLNVQTFEGPWDQGINLTISLCTCIGIFLFTSPIVYIDGFPKAAMIVTQQNQWRLMTSPSNIQLCRQGTGGTQKLGDQCRRQSFDVYTRLSKCFHHIQRIMINDKTALVPLIIWKYGMSAPLIPCSTHLIPKLTK
jgi:hypothetical protein